MHLYFDIGWYGVLTGTSLAFLSVYATRIHASGQQIGLISAGPAIMNLIFTLPAGLILSRFRVNKSVFWASVLNRMFYASWVFLPLFVPEKTAIWIILFSTILMNIPGSVLAVGFTVFLGDSVPVEWRSMVAGIRNAVIGLVTMITTLISGQILKHTSLDTGYAIVFAIGFLGAVMSSYHIFMVRPIVNQLVPQPSQLNKPQTKINFGILKGKYGRVMVMMFFFHFFQYLPIPLFPIFQINFLKMDELNISIGSTLFYFTQFIISLRLDPLVRRSNNLRVMGIGMLLYGIYPFLLTFVQAPWMFYVVSALGGIALGLFGGVLYNFLLERMGETDRPSHMVVYNLALNAAVLGGSMLGPLLAGWVDYVPALIISAIFRSLVGAAILRWG